MQIRKVSSYTDFLSLREDWNNLLKKSENNSVFLRHEWFDCWWRTHAETYEHNQSLSILLIEDGGKCSGIFPLKTSRAKYRGLKVKKLGFLESGLTPFCDFMMTEDSKEKHIEDALLFLKNKNNWDVLILSKMPTESENCNILIKLLKELNLRFGVKSSLYIPVVNTSSDWLDFFSQRSTKFKKSMRNKLNRAKRLSSLQFEHLSELNDVKNALPLIFEVSQRSWKAELKHSIADTSEYKAFLEHFSAETGDKGWINVWLLKNGEQCIAYEYHLRYEGVVYPIAADFDERFRELSPGSILEYHILKTLFDDAGVREYNTCAQSYKYLRNWTDILKPHVDIEIFNSKALPALLYHVEYVLLPYLRRVPFLQHAKGYFQDKSIRAKHNAKGTP